MNQRASPSCWPSGSTEMADRIREHDWAATALGPLESWPQSLRTAVDIMLHSPEPISVLWGPERIQLYNDAYIPIAAERHPASFGQSAAETWGDAYVSFLGPILDRVFAGEAVTIKDESVALRSPGDEGTAERQFTASFSPIRDEAGAVAGIFHPVTETTERILAERQLRQGEERFRAIVETATDYAIFTIDPQGLITTWPRGAQEVFGWSADEAIGQPVDMTFTPEDRAIGAPETERITARTAGQAPDVRWHLRRDGSRIFIDGISRPLRAEGGAVTGFVKVGQDVTEQRATEGALRESEARFRQFGDASADGLWIRDAATLAFEYLSPAVEEIYGTPIENFLRGNHVRRWAETIVPEDRRAVIANLRRLRSGEHFLQSFRILRSDGVVRWIRDTSFPLLDEDGRVQRIGGIAHDATEEVELQDRLKVLVAELQHRSRNLVSVVQGMSERTLATSETLTDFRRRFRARLGALGRVNSLLSRLEEGDRITFDQLLRTELQAHGVVGFDGQGEQVIIRGPKGIRLRSATVQTFALALHELATNALKYGALSRPEGRLEIKWGLLPARGLLRGIGEQRLRVDWRETGVPVSSEAPPRRKGYGRELIERALPYQLKAETAYQLAPEGVRCSIIVPVSSTLDVAFSVGGGADA